jgi:hypothetical protein
MIYQGSLQSRLMEGTVRPGSFKVGEGATETFHSDRRAGTVVKVSPSGKTVWVQPDIATRTDNRGMGDAQDYVYERYTNGPVIAYRWSAAKGRFTHLGGSGLIKGRHEHYDFSF